MVRIHTLTKGDNGHVKVSSKNSRSTLLRCPVKCLFPLEEGCGAQEVEDGNGNGTVPPRGNVTS